MTPKADIDRPPKHFGYKGQYAPSGVDLSLLRYMLRLTPLERVRKMEEFAKEVAILYEYGRQHRQAQASENR